MVGKSARLLAPIALVAVAFGIYVVVHANLSQSTTAVAQTTTGATRVQSLRSAAGHAKRTARFYVVRSGDTLSGIAARTGVAMTTLIQLNPSLARSQNSLQIGQRLRLRS